MVKFLLMVRGWLKLGVKSLRKLRYEQKSSFAQFEEKVRTFLHADHCMLDIGCGAVTRVAVKGSCRMVVGVDADQRICSNPGVDVLVRGDISRLPFGDDFFDLAMSWMVVEHLDEPQACFAELGRVCKKGAVVIIVTPNVLHYANFIVKLTPYRFHEWFIRHILGGRGESFPTRYRANSPRKLAKMMEKEGFMTVEMRCIDEGPAYLDALTPLYLAGLIYHRLVNRFDKLSFLRAEIFGVFVRQG